MPLISGPKNSRYAYTGSPCPHNDLALRSSARTLGEAIQHYESKFGVAIRPCTKPLPGESEVKYFEVSEAGAGITWLVDIHVVRGSAEICPKQDLSFPLLESDLVEMGELAC
jgi:hypothetical protein